jgi:hypothetical protein
VPSKWHHLNDFDKIVKMNEKEQSNILEKAEFSYFCGLINTLRTVSFFQLGRFICLKNEKHSADSCLQRVPE